MKAFVAGGTGFIGSHIVQNLISRDITVRILVRNSGNTALQRDRRIEYAIGDVLDAASLQKHVKDVDLVFSSFGILGQWGVPDKTYRDINIEGVINLIDSCIDSDIKQFIHISSAGVLGPFPDGVVADESFPYNPSNIYERTKSEAEKEIMNLCAKHAIPYTIIRPEFVYGPGDKHVLGLFRAIKAGKFVLIGRGGTLLHPTYIDDLVRGISLCINNGKAFGKIYLITGERPVTVKELAETIAGELATELPKIRLPLLVARTAAGIMEFGARIFGFEPVLSRSRVNFFTENRAFTFRKAETELGYFPKVGFREGVKRTVQWYREHNYL